MVNDYIKSRPTAKPLAKNSDLFEDSMKDKETASCTNGPKSVLAQPYMQIHSPPQIQTQAKKKVAASLRLGDKQASIPP